MYNYICLLHNALFLNTVISSLNVYAKIINLATSFNFSIFVLRNVLGGFGFLRSRELAEWAGIVRPLVAMVLDEMVDFVGDAVKFLTASKAMAHGSEVVRIRLQNIS